MSHPPKLNSFTGDNFNKLELEEIKQLEQSIPAQLRTIIHDTIFSPNTELEVYDLPDDNPLTLLESYYACRWVESRFAPAVLIQGITYHDGKTDSTVDLGSDVNRYYNEINHVRIHTLSDVKNLVITEWVFFEEGDQDPRDITQRRTLRPNPPDLDDSEYTGSFFNGVTHKAFTRNKPLINRYVQFLQLRNSPPGKPLDPAE